MEKYVKLKSKRHMRVYGRNVEPGDFFEVVSPKAKEMVRMGRAVKIKEDLPPKTVTREIGEAPEAPEKVANKPKKQGRPSKNG